MTDHIRVGDRVRLTEDWHGFRALDGGAIYYPAGTEGEVRAFGPTSVYAAMPTGEGGHRLTVLADGTYEVVTDETNVEVPDA